MSNSMKSLLMRTGLITAALGVASPAAIAAVVEGKVTAGGAGVEGALVQVVETGQSVATGADGGFRFGALEEGSYTLSVSYIGAESQTAEVSTTDDEIGRVNFALDAADRVLDSVIVTGQRGSMFAGINQQRAADNLISVISADAVGQFPDQNVAESIRRAPGVAVANDQGEGRFVIIRGVDPALNAVSVNGVRLASPEADTRAVALDVIDADILDSVEVIKSLTPDLDGDGIGGSINIKTMSAFDKDGLFIKAKADAIYTESSEEVSPKLSIAASQIFMDGRLGLAGSLSYQSQERHNSNTETDGLLTDGSIIFPEELELRHYEVERERFSAALNADYLVGNHTDLYVRTLFNSFEDQEYRHRIEIKPVDGDEDTPFTQTNGVLNFTASPSDSDDVTMEFDRNIKNRLETQQIWSIQTGGQTRFDAVTFDYQFAYSHSEEEEPDRVDTEFRTKFEGGDDQTFTLGIDNSDPELPKLVSVSDAFYDASAFEFEEVSFVNGLTQEEEFAAKLDITREGNVFGQPGFVKGGFKVRVREKEYDYTETVYDGFDGDDYTLAQFSYEPDYTLADFGPSVNPGAARDFFFANQDLFEVHDIDTAIATYANRFEAAENIYAGFIMAQSDFGAALFTGGLRMEVTDFWGEGYRVTEFEGDVSEAPEGILIAGDADEGAYIEYRRERSNYVDLLPSLNGRFDVSETIVARAAYYASIARPSMRQLTPASELVKDGEDWDEATLGNPELNRQQAHNVDFAVEWYPSSQGVLSLGAFMKHIDNPIAEVVFNDYEVDGITFGEVTQFQNLRDGTLSGLEFNYQQGFEGILPGVLSGVIVGVNYTLVDSQSTFVYSDENEAEEVVTRSRSVAMPKTAEETANVVLGYDKHGLDLRLALNYNSGYLDEVGGDADQLDRVLKDRFFVDVTAKYKINDNLTVVGEFANITDEPEHYIISSPVGNALSQYDEYGYTAKFGVRYTY